MLANIMRVLANLMRVSFLPVRVLANLMTQVYFLQVRVIIADLMKLCLHTLRVLADLKTMVRVLANHTSSFLANESECVHDLNKAGRVPYLHDQTV